VLTIVLAIAGAIWWRIDTRTGHSRSIAAFIYWNCRYEVWKFGEKVRPWTNPVAMDARTVRSAADLYRITNIWPAHLSFTRAQWKGLDAHRIEPLPNFIRSGGQILLRNPSAPRSGLAGVMGYVFDWSAGDLDLAGLRFTNIGVRLKGNVGAMIPPKLPFKLDLNRNIKTQNLAGLEHLGFNNLIWDQSSLCDALGYDFFRDAGVPAPRTAYAWMTASVAGRFDRQPLGLYLMVEAVDETFAAEHFGSKKTPLFKPVTYEFFEDLGDDWNAYAAIYDSKTKLTAGHQRRVMDFAHLVSKANDADFAARLGEFLDLDEFARFLAGEVLIANYDSLLTTGQNFFLYLDPRSNKFGFIPWDLDAAWANFWIAPHEDLAHASIWHPWVGENRFLARVMAVEEFRKIYRERLEDILANVFVAERLQRRIDEIAAVIRAPIQAESKFRSHKFEQEVGAIPVVHDKGETAGGYNHTAHPYKTFIEIRSKSVRDQLDGKSEGLIIKPLNTP